ncbi:hypothetical protein AAC691_15525 [Nguyenibacter vanlangensis]|uniref:Uncharacterized protein n=1 Tax=Nguyenibacter vanlangensis TaxID=1216886 RepID=A0ABZ3D2A3_9PROT
MNVPVDGNVTLYMRGPASITLASVNGSISAAASVTTGWAPGLYSFSARLTDDAGNVDEIAAGTVEIKPDIATIAPGTDIRSQNRRTYDAICAVIENRASMDQQSYKINNRELVRTPIADLLTLRARYKSLVAQENGRGGVREHRVIF